MTVGADNTQVGLLEHASNVRQKVVFTLGTHDSADGAVAAVNSEFCQQKKHSSNQMHHFAELKIITGVTDIGAALSAVGEKMMEGRRSDVPLHVVVGKSIDHLR